MAVLESDTTKPIRVAAGQDMPSWRKTSAVTTEVAATWSAPLPTMRPSTRRSRSSENSIPTPNSSSATPSSASCSSASVPLTQPSTPGPTSTPATR